MTVSCLGCGSAGCRLSRGPWCECAPTRCARRVINQNFLIGVVFILGGLVLAGLGYLNPIIAAVLHNAGSLLVVFNSARLVRMGEHLEPYTQTTASEPSVTACAPCMRDELV